MSSSSPRVGALAPFYACRKSRQAYLDRSNLLLAALEAPTATQSTQLTLPNVEKENEDISTSTFVIRSLSDEECSTLLQKCSCHFVNDNCNFRVMYRMSKIEGQMDISTALQQQVRNCSFGENVILGLLLDGDDLIQANSPIRSGVTNNGLVQNSILEPGSSVHNNSHISNTHVMKYASIIGCGAVSCKQETIRKSKDKFRFDMYDGSMDVQVGPEAGGHRVVTVRVESTLVDVCRDLNMDSNGGTIAPLMDYSHTNKQGPPMNILCPYSALSYTPQINHIQLLSCSSIHSATFVESALLLPHSTIKNGCTVSHALLQWSATLTSHTDAHHIFLMEQSVVGPHSFTANAIYGPDSHVSGGEVHCSIFGPNANSHHQSLLIGILWPLGRGNVGYGSNVGSNHTGRIPDQETSVGEGTFWGLGCVIKFPVDLTSAPYSIVAAGVQLPPQRITLPFSLITEGPGGMNQLTPGWLLHYSPYTIARSEVKFRSRRTAKRHDFYTGWKIMRAGIMDLLLDARNALEYAGKQKDQLGGEGSKSRVTVFKTGKAVPGLGANQLTEKGRQIGIRAYTEALQRYAMRGLLDRLVSLIKNHNELSYDEVLIHVGLKGVDNVRLTSDTTLPKFSVKWPVLPWNEPSHADAAASWKHQHSILMRELPSLIHDWDKNDTILSQILLKCIALEDDHAKRVYDSKARDDSRGAGTVPGYKDVHVAAEKDSVVLAAKEEADQVKKDVKMVEETLVVLSKCGPARSRL